MHVDNGTRLSEEITSCLHSVATTSASTVRTLRILLGCNDKCGPSKAATGLPPKIGQKARSKREPGTVTTICKKIKPEATAFEIHKTPSLDLKPLKVAERRKLATQVFNTSLKCLSTAAKSKQETKANVPSGKSTDSGRNAHTVPLQPSSPNKPSKTAAQEYPQLQKCEETSFVAECALVALHCLRQLEPEENQVDERLEKGAVILVEKLISLGLSESAFTATTTIFEQYWKRRKGVTKNVLEIYNNSTGASSPALHVSVGSNALSQSDFDLISSYQSQVLRLAILLGPRAVTETFMEEIKWTSAGSPASIVFHGMKSGFLHREKAGGHLRTIAQALLKLYSVLSVDKSRPSCDPALVFRLLVEALTIKCQSWSLLIHTPDLGREYWAQLMKGLKRFGTDCGDADGHKLDFMSNLVRGASSELRDKDHDHAIPANVIHVMLDFADRCDGCPEVLNLLKDCQTDSASWHRVHQMIFHWRTAIIHYRRSGIQDELSAQAFERASECFGELAGYDYLCADDMLLHGAKLRKTAVSASQALERSFHEPANQQKSLNLVSCCVRILTSLSHLLFNLMQPTENETRRKLGLTSFAKTFEALLDVCRQWISRSPALREQCDSGLDLCVKNTKVLLLEKVFDQCDDQITAFLNSLLAQTSHLYWLRYVEGPVEASLNRDTLRCLKISCGVINDTCLKTKRAAMYGVKLEKLALGYLALRDIKSACRLFEETVDYYVSLGALDEAVNAAVSEPSHGIWSRRGTNSYLLGKTIASLTKLYLTYEMASATTDSWIFDMRTASPTQRSVLFAAQLNAIDDHTFQSKQLEDFRVHVHSMLEICGNSELQVYRLRLLSNVLHVISRNPSLSDAHIVTGSTFANVVETMQLKTNAQLTSYHESTLHLVHLQWLMQLKEIDVVKIEKHVNTLSSFLVKLSDTVMLESSVDNFNVLLTVFQALNNFGRVLGNTELVFDCLLATKHVLSLTGSKSSERSIDIYTQLASLYRQTGNAAQANRTFAAAQQLLAEGAQGSIAHARWALAYVEHLMDTSNMSTVEDAYDIATSYHETAKPLKECSGRERLEREALVAKSAQIAGQISFGVGNLSSANHLTKKSVKLSTDIWRAIERSQTQSTVMTDPGSDTMMQSVLGEMSNLTLSFEHPQAQSKLKGSVYWPYVDLHCSTLRQVATVSMYNGLYQDAVYFAKQLQKVATAVNSSLQITRASAVVALVHAKAGHDVEAATLLKNSPQQLDNLQHIDDRLCALLRAEAFVELKNVASACAILDVLEQAPILSEASVDTEPRANQGIHKAPIRGIAKVSRPIKNPAKRQRQPDRSQALDVQLKQPEDCLTYSQRYVRDKCQALRNQICLIKEDIPTTLPATRLTTNGSLNAAEASITIAMIMLEQALRELSSDPVKCVLAETAIALPVRFRSSRKSGRVSYVQSIDRPVRAKGAGHARDKRTGLRQNITTTTTTTAKANSSQQLVVDAQNLLRSLQDEHGQLYTSHMLHLINKIQYQSALLASTMDVPLSMSSFELVLQSLSSKNLVQSREHSTIKAERSTKDKVQILEWPDIRSLRSQNEMSTFLDCSMDDLTEIPEAWSIVSISLAENQQELLMSKIVANRSPFLLQIPLSRSELEVDEMDFKFEDARAELVEIVSAANASAHDARGQADKETRKVWYAEREELDERLAGWLDSVENVWLGGFRGLMSSAVFDDELLAEFGQSLDRILDKHLPSRQRTGSSKANVALHHHVLELFLGLGNPDEHELDDPATDLLYFVVDILQFSGEQNAYDEIDFDAMLVDVFDSLRACHHSDARNTSSPRHTILIVDKELASFPWESLPCLRSQSVSRMPCLSAIMERLRKIRAQSPTSSGYTIPAEKGAYILNPSSDLASTQSTFEPILHSQLPQYDTLTNQPPTESQFTSLLTDHSLLLYFGHGSGAQYIRGRVIRNLDHCAVTLLMGCSSAKMTECGKFESYGMPGYYVGGLSGCMAVVGTLWDVTDRDIDRFALRTMVEWGLIEETEEVSKSLERANKRNVKNNSSSSNSNRKGKPKPCSARQQRKGIVGLPGAVSKGRDACVLKYLNGAAPVVYGVPVFLS